MPVLWGFSVAKMGPSVSRTVASPAPIYGCLDLLISGYRLAVLQRLRGFYERPLVCFGAPVSRFMAWIKVSISATLNRLPRVWL